MGASCCAGDPSQERLIKTDIDTEKSKEGPTPTDKTESSNNSSTTAEYNTTSIITKKQSIPDDSYLKPTNNETELEESLQVPTGSVLDTVNDHEPVVHSEYEDNEDEYTINNQNEPGNENINENGYNNDDNKQKEEDDNNNENNNDEYNKQEEEPKEEEPPKAEEEPKEEEEPKPEEAINLFMDKQVKIMEEAISIKHKQIQILEDNDLRKRSVDLVTGDNNEFIKFLKKILKSKLNEKIWIKCDPNNTGKIETEKFMYFWTLPVTLFKVAIYQRKHGNKQKPKLDQKELRNEFKHLATWIIRRYGEKQDDGGATFTLTKDNFAKDIVEYVKNYADLKGELYEDY